MFLLKSLSLCCLGNSGDFHTRECKAAQNLSAWFAPREARTPSRRPGGNLRGSLVSLQSSNPCKPCDGCIFDSTCLSSLTNHLLYVRSNRMEGIEVWFILSWILADRGVSTNLKTNMVQKLNFSCTEWTRPEKWTAPNHVAILLIQFNKNIHRR